MTIRGLLLSLPLIALLGAPGTAQEEARRGACTCAEGNASYHYLRCPKTAPADPDPCPATFEGEHPSKNPPKEWNDACWLSPRMECFLRRHAKSWSITCSLCYEKPCCPFPNWKNCPECHGDAKEPENDATLTAIREHLAEIRKLCGNRRFEMAVSPNYVIISDIRSLKIATVSSPRIASQHEILHLALQRAEMARRDFIRYFGPVYPARSLMGWVDNAGDQRALNELYWGNPTTALLYGGGSKDRANGLASNGFVIKGDNDDELHFTSRHMIGHLLMSTYHHTSPFTKHLPEWLYRGAGHWLSKLHPRAEDFVFFCQRESRSGGGRVAAGQVSGSGADWDDKAKRIAMRGEKKDPVEAMLQANDAEMDFDMHVRAWSWFRIFLEEEREPFVQFVKSLRQAEEARIAAKNAWNQTPEQVDARWRERVLGKRRTVAASEREVENEGEAGAASARELQSILEEEDMQLLASRIRGLESCKNVRTARVLLDLMDQRDSARVRECIALVLGKTEDPEVLKFLYGQGWDGAGQLARAAVAKVLGDLKHEPAAKTLREKGLSDGFWLVRANAARSLAQLKDETAIQTIARMAANDSVGKVRIGAMDALAIYGSAAKSAAPVFESNVNHPAWQIRSATCDALAKLGNPSSVDVLIARIDREDGRLRDDLRRALKALTGVDRDWDGDLWNRWWAKAKQFQDVERRSAEALKEEGGGTPAPSADDRYAKKDEPRYYGVRVFARAIGFVLDVSGSMQQGFEVDPKLAAKMGRTYTSKTRIGVSREELTQSIRSLDPRTRINLVLFNHDVRVWHPAPVPASDGMKNSAIAMIHNTTPDGETNYYDALVEVLQAREAGGWSADFADTPDTLFFLSDGQPTAGDIQKGDELLAWFNERNRFARLRVNVIAMGNTGVDREFLKRLAEDNGGTFVHLTGSY